MPRSTERLTVGALARQAGISAQTLRHYHRLGLLRPAATSSGGYRLYTEQDRARLELIRALRAVDFDLDTIAHLLRGAASLRRVAELHLRTIDHQLRTLERRRAVLRVLLRSGTAPTTERLARLQGLAGFERMERERFLGEHLGERLRGTGNAALRRWIQTAAVVALPDSATEAQVEAWLELAEMVSDPEFLERHRGARSQKLLFVREANAEDWPATMKALYGPAAKAAKARIDPRGAEGRRIVRRWVQSYARHGPRRPAPALAKEMLQAIESNRDVREERFWQLVAVLNPSVAGSPMSIAWPWLMDALRGWVADLSD